MAPAVSQRSSTVCTLYQQALRLHQQGVHLICCDEKTGMQALERLYPTKAAIPGSVERQEAHYIRHGTQNLIANFEVATGRILAPTLAPTRSEAEFAHHVLQTLTRDLDGEWIFIVDNLNTHQSEFHLTVLCPWSCHLVTVPAILVADQGKKGRAKQSTRAPYALPVAGSFVYTPSHLVANED